MLSCWRGRVAAVFARQSAFCFSVETLCTVEGTCWASWWYWVESESGFCGVEVAMGSQASMGGLVLLVVLVLLHQPMWHACGSVPVVVTVWLWVCVAWWRSVWLVLTDVHDPGCRQMGKGKRNGRRERRESLLAIGLGALL